MVSEKLREFLGRRVFKGTERVNEGETVLETKGGDQLLLSYDLVLEGQSDQPVKQPQVKTWGAVQKEAPKPAVVAEATVVEEPKKEVPATTDPEDRTFSALFRTYGQKRGSATVAGPDLRKDFPELGMAPAAPAISQPAISPVKSKPAPRKEKKTVEEDPAPEAVVEERNDGTAVFNLRRIVSRLVAVRGVDLEEDAVKGKYRNRTFVASEC